MKIFKELRGLGKWKRISIGLLITTIMLTVLEKTIVIAVKEQQIRKGKTNRDHILLRVLCLIGKMTLSQSQYKK